MQIAQETVQLLYGLIAASADQDWTRVTEIRRVIDSTADDARKLRRDIRRHLPRGLLLAMPRPDLLELLDIQNRIALCACDIARPIALRSMQFPANLQGILDKLCGLLATTVSEALMAIRELDELITAGFGKRERKVVEKLLTSLERNVQRCNLQQQRLLRNLSKTEENLPVLDVIFYYQITATLGELGDACGEVGEQLDLLLAR